MSRSGEWRFVININIDSHYPFMIVKSRHDCKVPTGVIDNEYQVAMADLVPGLFEELLRVRRLVEVQVAAKNLIGRG